MAGQIDNIRNWVIGIFAMLSFGVLLLFIGLARLEHLLAQIRNNTDRDD
ncbi:MAG: hypothetical protein HYR84_04850 [Planctomycetes bacterium]|nr:hypothetical protein [Planctomycetota bacterium]